MMRRLSTSTLLQVVLLSGIFVLNFFEETDPDFWWHLATGRFIVESATLPRTDIFSYTAAGQAWIAHEWLAEIAMFQLYRAGGYLTLVVVFASLITVAYATVFRTLRLFGTGVAASTLITAWMAAMSVASWNVRPQAFSYLFFALYLHVLVRSRLRHDRTVWLIPAIMIVWANLHAGYVMGLLLVGLFAAGEAVNRWTVRRVGTGGSAGPYGDEAPSLRRYALVLAATVAATAVNPQGISLLLYPFQYAGTQNASMKFITEWQSPNFHNYYFFVFGAAMLLLMLGPARRRQDWALALPLMAMTAMALQSIRVITFFAIAAAPYIWLRLGLGDGTSGGVGDEEGGRRGGSEPRTQNPEPVGAHCMRPSAAPSTQHARARRHSSRVNWFLLAVCLTIMAVPIAVSDRSQVRAEPRTAGYPVEGVRYLQQAGLTGNLFNTYHWGGYLDWIFYPDRKVFVDGRADVYGDRLVEEYITAYEGKAGWRQVLEEHDIGVVLTEKESRLATLLAATGEWNESFRGDVESIFVRK